MLPAGTKITTKIKSRRSVLKWNFVKVELIIVSLVRKGKLND